MAKSDLVPLFILIFAIDLSLLIFFNMGTATTSLFKMVYEIWTGTTGGFIPWIESNVLGVIGIAGFATILIGSAFTQKSDFIIYGSFFFVFASYVFVFFNVGKQLTIMFNSFFTGPSGGTLLAAIIVMPIVILYFVALLRFWRGLE